MVLVQTSRRAGIYGTLTNHLGKTAHGHGDHECPCPPLETLKDLNPQTRSEYSEEEDVGPKIRSVAIDSCVDGAQV